MVRTALRAQIVSLLPHGERWRIETAQITEDQFEARAIIRATGGRASEAERNLRDLLRAISDSPQRPRRG